MSVRVMTWVWEHSKSEPTDRLVLLAIADCANDAGAEAYPSLATLVTKTGLHERSVQRSLIRLTDLGELAVQPRGGPRGCNRYRVTLNPGTAPPPAQRHPGTAPPRHTVTPAESRSDPGTAPGQTPAQRHPNRPLTIREPSVTKTTSSSTRGTRIADDFAATTEMIGWARENTPLVGAKETATFVDYWRGRAGAAALKVDWLATWRNWMRREQRQAEQNQARAPNGRASPSTATQRAEAAIDAGKAARAMLEADRKEITA